MKISKNQWIVIGIVGAIAIWYFFLRKKDTKESSFANLGCPNGACDCLGSPKPGGGYEKTCACCGGARVIKRNATTTNESNFWVDDILRALRATKETKKI